MADNVSNNKKVKQITYTEQEVSDYHRSYPNNGKIEIIGKTPATNAKDLTLAYSPGVALACAAIQKNPLELYNMTNIGNSIAVISNGTRILGLGDIGIAGYPVMEGKSLLFKALADVDAFPLILNQMDPDKFIDIVAGLSQNFSGINLEDIRKPDCFYIERKLNKMLNLPVFHDDQWGTAIVTLAGVLNAIKVVGKKIGDVRVTMNGAGASGIAISHMLLEAGVKGSHMNTIDRVGTLYSGRGAMDPYKEELANALNPSKDALSLEDAVVGTDILIGASSAGAFSQDMVRSMNDDAIVFAIANPTPEIYPDLAYEAGALIVGTGRSDFPNQINNVLGFPGIFRGVLDVRATEVTGRMKVAAAHAIASMTSDDELSPGKIITTPVDPRLMATEAAAVAEAAMLDNVARLKRSPSEIYDMTYERVEFYIKHHGKLVETRNQLRSL